MSFNKKIFNPDGDDNLSQRFLVDGNPTNLNNFNDVKYLWTNDLYRMMMANFWIPEKISLQQDKIQYLELSKEDKEGFDKTFSFLTFLDSIQSINLSYLANYITAPEVKRLLYIQQYQEIIHSQAYAYVLESVVPVEDRKRILYLWRDYELLRDRNAYIADLYQNFIDTPNDKTFGESMISNYILEGLYFYSGFNYFYNLGYRKKMMGTMSNIIYINRDESTHMRIFRECICQLMIEKPECINKERIYDMFRAGVEAEIAWALPTYGNGIPGINKNSIENYPKFLANKLLKSIKLDPIYPESTVNPYSHLEQFKADGKSDLKKNFFETTVNEYNMSSAIIGWEKI